MSESAVKLVEGDEEVAIGRSEMLDRYIDTMSFIERLHRLLLDVIKDEFERIGIIDINSVQALLLFNIGDNEVTAGELKSRGYYQGSNVSYNIKKLVESGYISHERCSVDRRAVRIRLTEKGVEVRTVVASLWARHAQSFEEGGAIGIEQLATLENSMKQLERFWTDQIRYIY